MKEFGMQGSPDLFGMEMSTTGIRVPDPSMTPASFPNKMLSLGGASAGTTPKDDIGGIARPPLNPHKTRLRLAYVIDCIHDWNLGGTEKQLASMVKALDPQVFDPMIFILQTPDGDRVKELGCPIIFVNRDYKGQSRYRSFTNLRAALRRFQPQIVQTFFIDGTFYGAAAAWLNDVPVIVQSRRNAGHWQKPYHTLALRLTNRAVHSWQCNSRFVAEMIQRTEHLPKDCIEVLYNSIDTDYFAPVTSNGRLDARRSLGLPLDAPVFVAVSTLRRVKGLSTIVNAASKVRLQMPHVQFIIVGDGPQHSELTEQIARENLDKTVHLAGAQKDVRPWLAAADLGLLASHSESSSNALMEYMSMGLPSIVSNIPANRELVQEVYFAPGNEIELAERLLWLWGQDDLRQRMAKDYRQTAAQFGRVAFSECLRNYYLGLAAKYIPGATYGG
jgi:glycosyltransferase involved in cell wall biosynthesis